MAKEPAYTYGIEIIKIVDGDTIDVLIDLGFHIKVKKKVRLQGINAPESRTRDLAEKKRGLAAKARLREMCSDEEFGEAKLVLKCHGIGKYGRVLGEIFNHNCNLNRMMVSEGFATEYHGGKR